MHYIIYIRKHEPLTCSGNKGRRNIPKLRSMNKQSKEFSCKRNPQIHQRQPFRRGEHTALTDHSARLALRCAHALLCTGESSRGNGLAGEERDGTSRNSRVCGRRHVGSPGKWYKNLIIIGPAYSWTSVPFSLQLFSADGGTPRNFYPHTRSVDQNCSM